MVKCCFVNLPWQTGGLSGVRAGSRWPHLKSPEEGSYMPFPFYLAYAAGLLHRHGFEVLLIDAIAEGLSYQQTRQKITDFNPHLLLAETSTVTSDHDLSELAGYRHLAPLIAVCGPDHALSDPELLRSNPPLDILLYGEYEQTALAIATALRNSSPFSDIPGIIYRNGTEIKKNPPRQLLENLDWLAWPLRRQLPMYTYCDTPCGIAEPCAMMWASRGCPFRCSFCLWPQVMYGGNTYRVRSVVDVVNEMEYLVKRLRFRSIYFDDDTWNVRKEWIYAFCRELQRRNLRIPWAIMASATLMDRPLLEEMKKSGLFAVKYGVESASPELLRNINKGLNLDKLREVVAHTHQLGIRTHLTFTFGLPGETARTAKKTIALATELNPFSVQFSLATPFPGTRFYRQMQQEGKIVSHNLAQYDGNYGCVIRTDALSAAQLKNFKNRAYRTWAFHCWKRRPPAERWEFVLRVTEKIAATGVRVACAGQKFSKAVLKRFVHLLKKAVRSVLQRLPYGYRLLKSLPSPAEAADNHLIKNHIGISSCDRRINLLWHGRTITKNVGLTTSFLHGGVWYDSSHAIWTKELFSGAHARFVLFWPEPDLRQVWEIDLQENGEIIWRTELLCTTEKEIAEYKSGMMLPPVYDTWHDGSGVGLFPPVSGWQDIGLYDHAATAVAVSAHYSRNRHLYPKIELALIKSNRHSLHLQLQNTAQGMNARLAQLRAMLSGPLPPGRYTGEIRIRLTEYLPVQPPLSLYRGNQAFRYLKEKIAFRGKSAVLKKILRNLYPRKIVEYYAEILGVMDGAYAYCGPKFVQIDLTNDCNNDCIGCWCNSQLLGVKKKDDVYKRQHLPTTLVLDTIRSLRRMGTKEIYFAGGGEPFMHPHILKIIEFVKSAGMKCYINTNFTLVTKQTASRLIELGVDHLIVSVWAGTPQTYVKTHPSKSEQTFEELTDTLRYLHTHKTTAPHVNIYNVISTANYHEMEQMLDLAVEVGAETVEFTVIDTIPDGTDVLLLNDRQRKEVVAACSRINSRLHGDLKDKIRIQQFDQFVRRVSGDDARDADYDRRMLEELPCYIGWVFSRIMADGDVNFCLKAHKAPVGNLYADSFAKIWNGERQRQIRSIARHPGKNHPFFSCIGNDPNATVGCYKSCDDMARVMNTYKKVQSLSALESILLRAVLFGHKAVRHARTGKLFRYGAGTKKHSVAGKTDIYSGAIRLRFENGSIRIFYQERELTQQVGMNASLCVNGIWYDSSHTNWAVERRSTHTIVLKSDWRNLPIVHRWQISINRDRISVKIIQETTVPFVREEEKLAVMLSGEYPRWTCDTVQGDFPESLKWQDIRLPESTKTPYAVFGTTAYRKDSRLTPGILFDLQSSDRQMEPHAQNSDRMTGARIIALRRILPDCRRNSTPGTALFFQGDLVLTEQT